MKITSIVAISFVLLAAGVIVRDGERQATQAVIRADDCCPPPCPPICPPG